MNKINHNFQGKKISLIFETLPPMEQWSQLALDYSTRIFLVNLVTFLSKRSADLQVLNEKDFLINIMTTNTWKKHQPLTGSLTEVSYDILLQADAIVGIGVSDKTKDEINNKNIPHMIIKTAKNEIFHDNTIVIDKDPELAIGEVIFQLHDVLK